MTELERRPRLNRGCNLKPDDSVVMIPEGLLKLSPSAVRILSLCDGSRSIDDILTELRSVFAPEMAPRIEADTIAFLDRLLEKAILVTA